MDVRSCYGSKVVIYWPATVEAWIHFQARPCTVHSGQKVVPEQIFLLSTVAFACQLLSTCMPYSSVYVTDTLRKVNTDMIPNCYGDRLILYQTSSELMPLVPMKKD